MGSGGGCGSRFRAGLLASDRFLEIGTHCQELLERVTHRVFRVVLLKGLAPVFAEVSKLHRRFGGGEAGTAAIYGLHALGFERVNRCSHRAQIRVQHADESAPHQKVEPAESYKRGRVVEHRTGRILQHTALFHKAVFHQIAEAMALLRLLENLVERFAPFQRSRIRLDKNRPQNSRHIAERDFLVQQVHCRAHHEILHQQQINLVAVGVRLVHLPQLAVDQGAQCLLAPIKNLRGQLPDLICQHFLVQRREPLQIAIEGFARGLFRREFAGRVRQRREIKLRGERRIDRVHQPRFLPLRRQIRRASFAHAIRGERRVHRRVRRFWGHGLIIQFPTSPTKRAATALPPPWYRTATTVARASSEPSEFTNRTWSSNSSGNVEEKRTSRAVPNSITVCSCNRRRPVTAVVTRTGIRTGETLGKSCASFSTHV